MIKIIKDTKAGKRRVIAFINGNQVDMLNINNSTFYQAKKYIRRLYIGGAYEQ